MRFIWGGIVHSRLISLAYSFLVDFTSRGIEIVKWYHRVFVIFEALLSCILNRTRN